MFRALVPTDIHPPFSAYSHGAAIDGPARIVFCSGQLGIAADGTIPSDCAGQAKLCFGNIRSVLKEAGMDLENIVRINTYVTGREHLAEYMAVRNALFSDPLPASTLMVVSGFARPEFVIEIEAVAAALIQA